MICCLKNCLSQRHVQLLIFALFLTGLGIAYYAELALGKDPCILCIYTRYAFMAGAVITGLSLLINALRFAIPLVLIGCLGISAFHVGVEQKWWKGPDACQAKVVDTSGLSPLDAMKKLKESLKTKQPVRCDEINWAILGISATIWNTLYLLMMLILSGVVICPSLCRKK